MLTNRFSSLNYRTDDTEESNDYSESGDILSKEPIKSIATMNLRDIRESFSRLVSEHRDQFDVTMMIKLWESWITCVPPFPSFLATKLDLIKSFVTDTDQTKLIIYNQIPRHRYEYHQICSLLKLDHASIESTDHRYGHCQSIKTEVLKTLIIVKPNDWCWEFTKVSDKQKELNDMKMKERIKKYREWIKVMRTKHCTVCNVSAVESELFLTDILVGLFCENCVKTDKLSGHTFKHAFGRKFYE